MIKVLVFLTLSVAAAFAGCDNYQLLPLSQVGAKPAGTCVRTLGSVTFVRRAPAKDAVEPKHELDQNAYLEAVNNYQRRVAAGGPLAAARAVEPRVEQFYVNEDAYKAAMQEYRSKFEYRFELMSANDQSIMVQASEEPYTGEVVEIYGTVDSYKGLPDIQMEKFVVVTGALPVRTGTSHSRTKPAKK